MEYTQNEVIQYVKENDVKFIKLFFTDIFGSLKSISIQPSILQRAFKEGVPFDASSELGFLRESDDDLYLVPDPTTLSVLPWRPQRGRVARLYCTIRHKDGSIFEGDMRSLLQATIKKAESLGVEVNVGTLCEFYLSKWTDGERHSHDYAGYCDVAPSDKGENVRRDIILTMEQMGIEPETSHHEKGNGQNQIDFKSSTTLKAADNFTTFKNVVTTIAVQDGLEASFNPIPHNFGAAQGSGLHFHFVLYKNGEKLIGETNPDAQAFAAGIINRISDITAFLNPVPESYARLGSHEAPRYITWSRGNHAQLIRFYTTFNEETQIVLRSPDPSCNQYLALALIIEAGLEGMQNKLTLPKSTDVDLRIAPESVTGKLKTLPLDYDEAWSLALKSSFVQGILSKRVIEAFKEAKVD